MTNEDATPQTPEPPTTQAPLPRPGALLFAAAFVTGMLFNLWYDATHDPYSGERLTIFLGCAALLILGVDVGKIWGRK